MGDDWLVDEEFIMTQDIEVNNLIVNSMLHLNGYKLTVNGDVTVNKEKIFIESGFLECRGNFIADQSIGCSMQQSGDYILVHGSMAVNWSNGYFLNGTLEIKGDFNTSYSYGGPPEGPSRVILSGERLQRVQLDRISFGILELRNYSEDGVLFSSIPIANEFLINGCAVSLEKEEGYRLGWTLSEDQKIEGDLKLFGDTLDLNGHSLTITGNLIQPGGTVVVNGGSLTVEGNYNLAEVPRKAYSSGRFIMQNAADYVRVEGDFVTSSSADGTGLLTDGVLEIKGDMIQESVRTYEENINNFYASDRHMVILSGDEDQVVKSNNTMTINHLELKNEWEAGIDTTEGCLVQGMLRTNGKTNLGTILVNNSSQVDGLYYPGSLSVLGEIRDLETAGDLYVSHETVISGNVVAGGNLISGYWGGPRSFPRSNPDMVFRIGKGHLFVKGDFCNYSAFTMEGEESYLTIEGSYINVNSPEVELTAGTMEIKGSFELRYGDFMASGQNRVILSGAVKQNIIGGANKIKFHILELRNTGGGVNVSGSMNAAELILNQSKLTYGGRECLPGQVLEADMVIDYAIALNADMDLNGHSLTIKGDLLHMGGNLQIHGGRLIVEGDYRQQGVIQEEDDISYGECRSGLVMQNKADYVQIGGSYFSSTLVETEELLTEGTLEIQGDLRILEGSRFRTGGGHILILKSDHIQTINNIFKDYWTESFIRNLIIDNGSSQGVLIEEAGFNVSGMVECRRGRVTGLLEVFPGTQILGNYAGDVIVSEQGDITGEWDIGGNLTFENSITLSGSVTVGKNLHIRSKYGFEKVILNEGRLLVKGNVSFQAINWRDYPEFSMTHNEDYFGVEGDLKLSYPWEMNCSAGITELKGNLSRSEANTDLLTADGTHTLLLSGEKKQTIQLRKDFDRLHIVELKNYSVDGVCFTSPVPIERIITNGCHLTYKDETGKVGWTLQENQVIEGDLHLIAGTLDLGGHQLTVNGSLIQADGVINVNGGKLIVEKDLRTQQWTGEKENETYMDGYGTLEMKNSEDYVLIKGDYLDGSRLNGILKAGTLEIQGDFNKLNETGESWMSENGLSVIFSGGQNQKAWSDSGRAVISKLEIKNKNGAAVEFGDGVTVKDALAANGNRTVGSLSVYGGTEFDSKIFDGNLKIVSEGTMLEDFEVAGDLEVLSGLTVKSVLNVHGNVIVKGGCLTLEAGNLTIGKDLNMVPDAGGQWEYALKMTDEKDVINTVGGYTDRSQRKTLWGSGTLRIKGDIEISQKCALVQMEGHKWIMDGSRRQTIDIGARECTLLYLELLNTSSEGVNMAKPVRITSLVSNGCHISYGGREGSYGWILNGDQTTNGDLNLSGGVLDLNGHTLTVTGDLNQFDGAIRINGGRLLVERDYNLYNNRLHQPKRRQYAHGWNAGASEQL